VGLLLEAFLHNRRRMALGVGWFLLTWLPISGLFPLNAPMAEHWLYVPLAGFLWALAEAVVDLARNPRVRTLAAGIGWAWCVLLIALTVARNKDWRDNETVFRDTLAKNPQSVRVHYNLAVTYEDILKNLPGARRHYEDVITLYKAQKKAAGREALYDEEIEARNSLGKICLQQGNYAAAAEHYRTILSIGADEKHAPLLASAAFGLGKCVLATGDVQRAGELFKRAVQFDPALKGEIERFAASLPATM
jgi:tetratricopeptide (TPR) repeat protein